MSVLTTVERLRNGTLKPWPMIGSMPARGHPCEEAIMWLRVSASADVCDDLGIPQGG